MDILQDVSSSHSKSILAEAAHKFVKPLKQFCIGILNILSRY